jgi:hypothetical protein
MFLKYASNLLQDLSNDCMLKSFACKNEEDSLMYRDVARRVDWLIARIGVEESLKATLKG